MENPNLDNCPVNELNVASMSDQRLRRRTVIGTAAWVAPVLVASVAAPAYAASGQPLTLSWSAPASVTVGEVVRSGIIVSANRGDESVSGLIVTVSVNDVALGGFGTNKTDVSSSVVLTVNESGVLELPPMIFTTGGALILTAAAEGVIVTHQISIAAATGTIAFAQSKYEVRAGSEFTIAGQVTLTTGTSYPEMVELAWTSGLSGAATAAVDPNNGAFIVSGLGTADAETLETITASATDFESASAQIATVYGYIQFDSSMYPSANTGQKYTISGTVVRLTSHSYPATVSFRWANDGSQYVNIVENLETITVAVNQSTGRFTLPPLTPVDNGKVVNGGAFGGQIAVTAPGYRDGSTRLVNGYSLTNGFTPSTIQLAPGETKAVTGVGQVYQVNDTFNVTYTSGVTGPTTVRVGSDKKFSIALKAPATIGTSSLRLTKVGGTANMQAVVVVL